MRGCLKACQLFAIFTIFYSGFAWAADHEEALALVKRGFDHLRGKASQSLVEMTILRPGWRRTMAIRGWTQGESDSLFRIVSPAKDRGNGTLKRGRQMWIYNPKVNRVIKVPPSMMSQSWMGSDFSNNDLAKSDSILNDYIHQIEATEFRTDVPVYRIRSVPKPDAPVVWGMQRLTIRKDGIWLRQEFYDEDGLLVKTMTGHDIQLMGGRLFPVRWRMVKTETPDAYTELVYRELSFNEGLAASLFTLANLRNSLR